METLKQNPKNILQSVSLFALINDVFALNKLTQEFENTSQVPLEIEMLVPLSDEVILKSLTVSLGEKTYISKIYDEIKAEEKYTDAISAGNTGVLMRQDEPSTYKLNLGNLEPMKKMRIETELIQSITCDDLSNEYTFSVFQIPFLSFQKGREIEGYQAFEFKAQYSSPSEITRLTCKSHMSQNEFSDDCKTGYISITSDEILKARKSKIQIVFRNQDINIPRIYQQYDPILKEYSYLIKFKMDQRKYEDNTMTIGADNQIQRAPDTDSTVSYAEKYSGISDLTPTMCVFLLDQSGSMSGRPIDEAKTALILFLKSLPSGSQFAVIGFGSTYKDYLGMLDYNQTNVSLAVRYIEGLSANLGGTDILEPLKYIYQGKYKTTLKQKIFLLTDGCVQNAPQCLQLIKENKISVNTLGIGNGIDKNFLMECGKSSAGSFICCENYQDIPKLVIKSLNQSFKNALWEINIDIVGNNITKNNTNVEYPSKEDLRNIQLFEDDTLIYGFISTEKLEVSQAKEILISSKFRNEKCGEVSQFEKLFSLELFDIGNGGMLSRCIAGRYLKSGQHSMSRLKSLQLASQYQILIPGLALFVEIEGNQKSAPNEKRIIKSSRVQDSVRGEIEMLMASNLDTLMQRSCCNLEQASPCFYKKAKCKRSAGCCAGGGDDSYDNSPPIRQEPVILEKRTVERNVTPVTKKNSQADYSLVIKSFSIEGSWSLENDQNGILHKIIQKNKDIANKLCSEYGKDLTIQQDADVILTIIIISLLQTKYAELRDQHAMICTKAKDYLKKNGISFQVAEAFLNSNYLSIDY